MSTSCSFSLFFFNDSKQDSATTTSNSKHLIELLNEKYIDVSIKSNVGNTDGCADQYICTSALCLMSVISQCYWVIISIIISAPGHGKEVVCGLNSIDKRYIYQLMSNGQLPELNDLVCRL